MFIKSPLFIEFRTQFHGYFTSKECFLKDSSRVYEDTPSQCVYVHGVLEMRT